MSGLICTVLFVKYTEFNNKETCFNLLCIGLYRLYGKSDFDESDFIHKCSSCEGNCDKYHVAL